MRLQPITMFSFLQSEQSKLRDAAKHWLYLAKKAYHFRKDELEDGELSELEGSIERLRTKMKDKKADSGSMKLVIDDIESVLRRVGGAFYPRSSLGENVDFFFVALIIYLGFTAFFIKPFKIPTNSMWPTYHGMTAEVWNAENEKPSLIARPFRFLAYGAKSYKMEAPADGELMIPVYGSARSGYSVLPPETVARRRFFVLPGQGRRYRFWIGSESAHIDVPQDFSLETQVMTPSLLPEADDYGDVLKELISRNGVGGRDRVRVQTAAGTMREIEVTLLKTGKFFKKGDSVLSFDILTGDQLFVDRMSYNFVRPKTGDGFVFRTGNIPGIAKDSFYIKRLVGTPGDSVRIDGSSLLVNGQPAAGSVAFGFNGEQVAPYRGYNASGLLDAGRTLDVKEGTYFALGDNSFNSEDGRAWGVVPEADVVGRPLVIYYPFTKRFGPVK